MISAEDAFFKEMLSQHNTELKELFWMGHFETDMTKIMDNQLFFCLKRNPAKNFIFTCYMNLKW